MYEENVIHDKEGKSIFFLLLKSFGMSNYSTFYIWCYIVQLNSRNDIKKETLANAVPKHTF